MTKKTYSKRRRKAIIGCTSLESSPASEEVIASNEDLLTEILLRLPAKSLIRFKRKKEENWASIPIKYMQCFYVFKSHFADLGFRVPIIKLSSCLIKHIRRPWKDCLIVRLLGKTLGSNKPVPELMLTTAVAKANGHGAGLDQAPTASSSGKQSIPDRG
ncbi:hypothetical protein LOK49_LG04G00512 [Camellia lanceoleosa]|uniref:Uncharacterized protein n=1 Tax=Camellia lanceoleosa TaxID=1840588 RepID=A0ACC0HTZ8_9ERIC|nr:hypothetical protein LOK49_LG04G00512 [Camellia lanceoleosa]